MTSFAFWVARETAGGFRCCCAESGAVAMPNVHFLLPTGAPLFWLRPAFTMRFTCAIQFTFFCLYLYSKKLGPVFFLSFCQLSLCRSTLFHESPRYTILRLDLTMSLIHYSICLALIHIAHANGISAATFPQIF